MAGWEGLGDMVGERRVRVGVVITRWGGVGWGGLGGWAVERDGW